MRTRRVVAAVVSTALVLAACGGADGVGDAGGSDGGDSDGETPAGELPPPADEVGVDAASDTATNVLPDVVVDDLQAGNEVNLRNLAPSDTPILLWMWAPH